jgi:hypothetical protein
MPVVLAIQEAEIRMTEVQSQPGQIVHNTPFQKKPITCCIYPKKCKTEYNRDTCTLMFITALFTIDKLWKKPRCLKTHEWIKKMCFTQP